MPAPVSVVIPTLDAASALPATLATLTEGLTAGLLRELVVSDGGSTDDTLAIADAAGAQVVTGSPGRGAQIARGVAEARGDWLLILHADTWLPAGWTEAAQGHMARAPDRAAAFRLAFRAEGAAPRLVAGWANLRSRALGLPYGDQGLLIRAATLRAAGGFPDIPLMEDVALARTLRGRIDLLPLAVRTSAARFEEGGWLRTGTRNLARLMRYAAGADPAALARRYGSRN